MKKKSLSILLVIALVMTLIVPSAGISYAGAEPSISVTSELLNRPSSYGVGDAAGLRYTVTPSGTVAQTTRPPVDTVLVLDVSNSMYGSKLTNLKNSAKAFVQHMKSNGVAGDKITLIYFHTRTTKVGTYSYPSFNGLESSIDNLSANRNDGVNGGTNYEDALTTANNYFSSASPANSVVFFSDGVPTFYNRDNGTLGGTGSEDPYRNYELEKCKSEGIQAAAALKNEATIYTISLGTNQTQHNLMGSIASNSSCALISPGTTELMAAFKKIAENVAAKEIANIKVQGTVPTGMTLVESSIPEGYALNWISQSTYEISVPKVIFPIGGATPSPFSFDLAFTIDSQGDKVLGAGFADFTDTNNVGRVQVIPGVLIYVGAKDNLSINVTSELANGQTNYKIGESGGVRYTVTPSGGVTSISRAPVNTVLVLDVSGSMSGTKLNSLKSSAKAFVQHMRANGVIGDKITLVSFHTYASQGTTYTYPNFSGIDEQIDGLIASNYTGINGGTNYEDALATVKSYFGSNADGNSAVFFSDGVPTYYDGNERYYLSWSWNPVQNKYMNQLVRRNNYEMNILGPGSYSTSDTVSQAQNAASDLKSVAKVYTISLGSDTTQHRVMSSLATNTSYALISPGITELAATFKNIAEKVTAKEFTNIKITGSVPAGMTINTGALQQGYTLRWLTASTYEISVPNVLFPADGSTPSPFSFNLPFTVNTEGTKVIGAGTATYTTAQNGNGSQAIPGLQLNVYLIAPPVITGTPTTPTNQNVTATVSYPGTTTARYYKVVAKGVNPDTVAYKAIAQTSASVTVTENESTIYAYSVNNNYTSVVTTYTVTNIDRVPPATPIITEGAPNDSGSGFSVTVTINYSADSLVKEYRMGTSGEWKIYTGPLTLSENGIVIQARGKDEAGNYSAVANHTIAQLIHGITESNLKFMTNRNTVLVVQDGSFVTIVNFQTTESTRSQIQFALVMDKNSSLFKKMILPAQIQTTDSSGNKVQFKVKKDLENGKIILTSVERVSAGTNNFSVRLLLKVNRANIGSYKINIEGSTSTDLKIDVVKNPPIK